MALLTRFCSKVSTGAATWCPDRRGNGAGKNAVKPGDTQDFLDEIGLALDVGPERGHLHHHLVGVAG